MSIDNPYQLSTQTQLEAGAFDIISDFWRKFAEEAYFISEDGHKIHYVAFCTPATEQAIVISPGRLESYIKYQELAFDLVNQGYAVFIIDHRGQGFSQRNLNNSHKGDIVSYDDFVNDWALWIETIILPLGFNKLFAMGHSMGCVILSLYQQAYPGRFDAMALASPMFGIHLSPLPRWFALLLSKGLTGLCHKVNVDPIFAPGMGNYKPSPFAENKLSHSSVRYQRYRQLYLDYPQIQLGGPTVRWLYQSLIAAEKTLKAAAKIKIPVLILQSGHDEVVTAQQQQDFYGKLLGNKTLKLIEGAYHELYQEADSYRIPSITAVLNLFSSHKV